MSETTAPPSAPGPAGDAAPSASADALPPVPADAPEAPVEPAFETVELSIRSLIEAGAHFGHQTRRWDPRMKPYIFGERNGTHIIDLDQTLPMFREALDAVRDVAANGGNVLFVATKRQASAWVEREARRCGMFYVNNRWLGGMLTNWRTVKKSIERYKSCLEILGDEERRAEHSKKELSRISRLAGKYDKSLSGIKDMPRLPDLIFVIDVGREQIAISEARRLGIPIAAVVDSNCNPEGIDYVVPGNDDAIRAVELYAKLVAEAVVEGKQAYNDRLEAEGSAPAPEPAPASGRRVVEIKQPPRRGRGAREASGRTQSAGRDDAAPAPEAPAPEAAPVAPEAAPAAAEPEAPAAPSEKPEG